MGAGIKRIRPPKTRDVAAFMRMLFLRTEQELINEINRKRRAGLVEYAEAASLERVQQILQGMVDESWDYVPKMVETIFYHSDKDAAGYRNARVLTAAQTDIVQQLSNNLLGEITEASETAFKSVQTLYTIARLEADPFREAALKEVLSQEAAGSGWSKAATKMAQELQNKGITAFVDRAGRHWSLQSYGNMAVRTTTRQAQVAAMLTADDYDLWQIVKIGSTCPVCAPLEGRVYSKSGTNPDYPPLSLAFGKIEPGGPDDLTNTYLNIHPNCLHAIVKYTTIGKTEKQIRKDKDFSSPEMNPLNRDPRTKKQIAAYREKERNRRRLLADMKEHKEYRAALGRDIPKDFARFREMKYNKAEKWEYAKGLKKYLEQYPASDKRFYDAGNELKKLGIKKGMLLPPVQKRAFILPEGKHDPYHVMHRMMERNITDDDVRGYMKNAKAMFVQWSGQRQLFVGSQGMCLITKDGDEWVYKTVWSKHDFGEESEIIMEVLKHVGL